MHKVLLGARPCVHYLLAWLVMPTSAAWLRSLRAHLSATILYSTAWLCPWMAFWCRQLEAAAETSSHLGWWQVQSQNWATAFSVNQPSGSEMHPAQWWMDSRAVCQAAYTTQTSCSRAQDTMQPLIYGISLWHFSTALQLFALSSTWRHRRVGACSCLQRTMTWQ